MCLIGGPSAQPGSLTIISPEPCLINGQYSAGFSSFKKLKIKPIDFSVVSMTPDAKILNKSPQHYMEKHDQRKWRKEFSKIFFFFNSGQHNDPKSQTLWQAFRLIWTHERKTMMGFCIWIYVLPTHATSAVGFSSHCSSCRFLQQRQKAKIGRWVTYVLGPSNWRYPCYF